VGFSGYVVSDCGAIYDIHTGHRFVDSEGKASALSVKAGTDLTCGTEYKSLIKAVKDGLIREEEINTALKRLMTARFKLGMFDPPRWSPTPNPNLRKRHASSSRTLSQGSA
jgi:beta-glucosidase